MDIGLTSILERKLSDAIGVVDGSTEAAISQAWGEVGPQPMAPNTVELMERLQAICVNGLNLREQAAIDVIQATLNLVKASITPKLAEEVMNSVVQYFPKDKYVSLVEGTPGVYLRRQAGAGKFQQSVYQNQLALVRACAANRASESIRRVQLLVDETLLQLGVGKSPWWTTPLRFMKLAFHWVLGIATTILTAYLLLHFGLK